MATSERRYYMVCFLISKTMFYSFFLNSKFVNNDAAKFFNGNHKALEIHNFEIRLKSNDTQNLKTRRT